jgi:hypothetical protein
MRTRRIQKEYMVTETIDDIRELEVLAVEEKPECFGYK